MFSNSSRTVVVVGAQWGDEGKGKLVDVLAERADWVVRYQGGANAGHTVDLGDVGLVKDGIDVEGRLYVSERAHLVLPYHKLIDKESSHSQSLGTTGRGIGPTYEDKIARRGVRVLDLRNPARLRGLVASNTERANAQLAAFGSSKRADVDRTMELLERLSPRLLPLAEDVGLLVHRATKSGAAVLLEGA